MMKQSWTFNKSIRLFLYDNEDPEARQNILKKHLSDASLTPVDEIELERQSNGKLILKSAQSSITFSLSHSKDLFLIAIDSKGRPIGIDIEFQNENHDFDLLARHLYTPQERDHLATLSGREKIEWGHRYWCLKEARFKMTGNSLKSSSNEVSICDGVGENYIYAACTLI